MACLGALVVCFLAICLFEKQRGHALFVFFIQPISSLSSLTGLISYIAPMVLVALGFTVVFQCRSYNLSLLGSFMLSACLVSIFLLQGDEKPSWYLIPTALVIGTAVGAATTAVPALFSLRRRVNITLSSLLLNYFVLQFTSFLLATYLQDPAAPVGASFEIPQRLWLARILPGTELRLGVLFAAGAVVLLYLLLYRSRLGYEIRSVGASESMSSYVGLSWGKVAMAAQLFAGALAGFGGAIEMMGIQTRYIWNEVFPSAALFAVLAVLLVDSNPVQVVLGCLFYGYLHQGAVLLHAETEFPSEIPLFVAVVSVLLYFAFCGGFTLQFSKLKAIFAEKQKAAKSEKKTPPAEDTETQEGEVN